METMEEPALNAQEAVIEYLRSEMLIADGEQPGPDDPLVSGGILDSFSMMALLDHLERTLAVKIARNKLVKNDFETLRNIEAFCARPAGAP
jgi:acyl carrier protein